MTIKVSKEAKESKKLYDSKTVQRIPIEFQHGNKHYLVYHHIEPLENDRFFQLQQEIDKTLSRQKSFKTEAYAPRHKLWKELAKEVEGYEKSETWKDDVPQFHCVQAINSGVLFVEVDYTAEEDADKPFSFSQDVTIKLKSQFSGCLVDTELIFADPADREMDRFIAIEENEPDRTQLASAKKETVAEKLFNLGSPLLKDKKGYKNDVPAWHIAKATEAMFLQKIQSLGKP